MKLSDKIANCKTCLNNAKYIDSINPNELFQNTWIDIWEFEQRNPKKASEVVDHVFYFFRAMRRRKNREERKTVHHYDIDNLNETLIKEVVISSDIPCQAFLEEWLKEKHEDEIEVFYRNIITLTINCKKKRDLVEMLDISPNSFYEQLNKAKQKLRDDFFRITNNNDIYNDIVV